MSSSVTIGAEDERISARLDDLRALPAETDWVEFKVNTLAPDRIGRTISALANAARYCDKPSGYLVWGVADGSHEAVGTAVDLSSAKEGNEPLEFWLGKRLNPSPALRVRTLERDGKRFVLLEIPAATTLPVRFEGIAYIRIGSATPKLQDFPERETTLLAKLQPFAWEGAAAMVFVPSERVLELLDHDAYVRLMGQPAPGSPPVLLERLRADRLVEPGDGGRWNILNLGAVLFARRLADFDGLGRKALRIVEYDGRDRSVTRRRRDLPRGYANGFEGFLELLGSFLPESEAIDGRRETRRAYPEIALRELLANALIHADMTVTGTGPIVEIFSDRIEFRNPGVPITDMLRKLFGAPPRSRNEALATLMRRMGLCEEQGSGLVKVIGAVEAERLPPPKFEALDGHLRATLFGPRPPSEMDRTDRIRACHQHAALLHQRGERMTNATLRGRLGLDEGSAPAVSRLLADCVRMGLIRLADPDRPKAGYVPEWA